MKAATLQARLPDATIDSVTNSAWLQGLPTGNDYVPAFPKQQKPPGTNDDVVSTAPREKVEKAIDMFAIGSISSTHNLRTHRQRVDVLYDEQDRDNKKNKISRLTKWLRRRLPVDTTPLAIAADGVYSLPTATTRRLYVNRVPSTLPVGAPMQYAF